MAADFLACTGRAFTALAKTGCLDFLAGGAGLRAGAFCLTLEEEDAFFGAGGFRAGATFVALPLAVAAEPDFVLDFEALRAGAFSDSERLTTGFGRAVLAPSFLFFAEDAEEV